MTCVFESHSVDFGFIQEVVDGSRKIIKKVLELSDGGILKFCPARIFSRIISASILLLKVGAISLSNPTVIVKGNCKIYHWSLKGRLADS